MIPTQARFTSERLCWFALEFFEEFLLHPSWQCRIADPALGAAFNIEQLDEPWDDRERLTKLLACFTRLAMFDNATHQVSRLIAWIVTVAAVLVAGHFGGTFTILMAAVIQGGGGYIILSFLYRAMCWAINRLRGRLEFYDHHLSEAAALYQGGIQLAYGDINRLKTYRIYGLYEYHAEFWARVIMDRIFTRIRDERKHTGSE